MAFVAVAIGVGVASTAVNLAAQSKAANEQNRYRRDLGISQNKQYEQNAAAVVRDVGLQIDQLAQRDIETAAATRMQLEQVARDAREAGATARAQTAAAGIEGRTVDLVHAQFARDVAEFESASIRNLRSFRSQSSMEAKAIYARGQNAINNGYPNPLPPPATVSPATSIMNGISTGIATYGALSSFRSPDVGAAANPTVNNPNAPWFLQANPSTPYLLSR
jgi:hypothetical protein